ISIGGRNAALRKAALAAAKRIGPVEVDHGDTACKTPDAAAYLDKTWAYATSKGHESPAAQERKRESMRLRCCRPFGPARAALPAPRLPRVRPGATPARPGWRSGWGSGASPARS